MKTTLHGWETKADKNVIAELEARFGKPLACFKPICQPNGVEDGYWHCRVSGIEGVIFVRQNEIGELHMYGPTKSVVFELTLPERKTQK